MTLDVTTATIPQAAAPRPDDGGGASVRGMRCWRAVIGIGVIALLASIAATVMTRWGTGLSTDSMTYLRAAAMFEQGRGVIEPDADGQVASPHFPPLYPLLISWLTVDGVKAATAARWLNVVLLAVNVGLAGALGWRATGRAGCAVAAAALVASSNALIELHAWAWSEPMFLAWMMAAMLALARSLSSGSMRALLLAALFTAAACVTRYAGVALLGTGGLAILVLGPWTLRRRFVYAASYGAVAGAPLALWLIRNRSLTATAVNRGVQVLGFEMRDFEQFFTTLIRWLLPLDLGLHLNTSVWSSCLILFAMAYVAIVAWRKSRTSRDEQAAEERLPALKTRQLLGLFVPCYLALVLLAVFFLDATTPLDTRILAPVQIGLIVGVVFLGARVVRVWPHRRLAPWVAFGTVALVGMNVYGSYRFGQHAAGRGLGLASRKWAESPLIGHARKLPPQTYIYTNMPELIEVHLGRSSTILPRPYNTATRQPIGSYDRRMRHTAAMLRKTDSAVVWFNRASRTDQYEREDAIIEKLDLARVVKARDGAIYVAAHNEPSTRAIAAENRRRREAAEAAERRRAHERRAAHAREQ